MTRPRISQCIFLLFIFVLIVTPASPSRSSAQDEFSSKTGGAAASFFFFLLPKMTKESTDVGSSSSPSSSSSSSELAMVTQNATASAMVASFVNQSSHVIACLYNESKQAVACLYNEAKQAMVSFYKERSEGSDGVSCPLSCFRPDPVCGKDGVTYWCGFADAECAGVEVDHVGYCDFGAKVTEGKGILATQSFLLVHMIWLMLAAGLLLLGVL